MQFMHITLKYLRRMKHQSECVSLGETKRRISGHSNELPRYTGHCIIFGDSDDDMPEMPCSLSALDFIQHEVTPQQPSTKKRELAVIGHLAR